MHNLDLQVLNAGRQWLHAHTVWLCTVISTFGSSPRPPGAMMVIRADGRYSGSLSGGCVEESFIERIQAQAFTAPSQLIRYGEGGYAPDQALPCGGSLLILVEKLPPDAQSQAYLTTLIDAFTQATALVKRVTLPEACTSLTPVGYSGKTLTEVCGDAITLTLATPPRLIVCGLSSVAVFCANFALTLGFETLVCEHRPDARLTLAPGLSEGITLLEVFPARYLEEHGCHAGTAILSLTHDPRIDDLTMMEAVHLPAFYLGAMGSVRNSQKRRERLVAFGDVTPAQLQRIHAPVGLAIGSKTPAEIALSIMADIVRHKNGMVSGSEAGAVAVPCAGLA